MSQLLTHLQNFLYFQINQLETAGFLLVRQNKANLYGKTTIFKNFHTLKIVNNSSYAKFPKFLYS